MKNSKENLYVDASWYPEGNSNIKGTGMSFEGFKTQLRNLFKVALIQNFLNFAKSCILSCLSKFDSKEKFHRAVFII